MNAPHFRFTKWLVCLSLVFGLYGPINLIPSAEGADVVEVEAVAETGLEKETEFEAQAESENEASTEAEGKSESIAPGVPVVILPFGNVSGDPEMNHWSRGFEHRIRVLLEFVDAVRVIRGATYGMREIGKSPGESLSEDEARKIGELTETRWVISGSWAERGDGWHLETRLLRTAGGESAVAFREVDEDWFGVVEATAVRILETLEIETSETERDEMSERPTKSMEAFECRVRAAVQQEENASYEEIVPLLRRAIAIDPDFEDGMNNLAAALLSQGNLDEGRALIREVLSKNPENAFAHYLEGIVLAQFDKDLDGGEKMFREAIRLEPRSHNAHLSLGTFAVERGKLPEAITHLEQARRLRPFNSHVHARLGIAQIQAGNRAVALESLNEAERLNQEDANTEINLGIAFRQLGDYPKSAQHFEKGLAIGRDIGAGSKLIDQVTAMLEPVKARLTPAFVEAPRPPVFSSVELRAELASRLTPEELELAVIPFEITPEMEAWVREKVGDSGSDLERAGVLFDILVQRVRGRGKGGSRTAEEVFARWDDPETTYSCQEYAKLFVGLGRAIGLDAFYVHLEKDYRGKVVYHDCAALFVDDRALLVDPAYHWFGVPHQEFEFLDDLETVAHHAFQGGAGDETWVPRCRLAVKLHPDHAWGQVAAAAAYVSAGDHRLARQHLDRAAELEPGRWDELLNRGRMTGQEGDSQMALQFLEQAKEKNPRSPAVHFFIGAALDDLKQIDQAREAYRAAVRNDDGYHDKLIAEARKQIAGSNEILAILEGDETVIRAVRENAEKGDVDSLVSLARLAAIFATQERFDEAEEIYRELLPRLETELGDSNPETFLAIQNRAVILAKTGRFAEAVPHFGRAYEGFNGAFGPIHPQTRSARNALAIVAGKNGDIEQSAKLFAANFLFEQGETAESGDVVIVGRLRAILASVPVEIAVGDPVDDALRDYYDRNPERFAEVWTQVWMISLPQGKKDRHFAENLRKELVGGADFGELARIHSDDSSAEKGGDRGMIKRGFLRKDLDRIVFGMKAGEFSGVIEDATHFRILKTGERQVGESPPFEKVKEKAIREWKEDQRDRKLQGWIEEARKRITAEKKAWEERQSKP